MINSQPVTGQGATSKSTAEHLQTKPAQAKPGSMAELKLLGRLNKIIYSP